MAEDEDIIFDTITQPLNFGSIAGNNTSNNFEEEKVYNSLYDELMDKCCPDKFCSSTTSFDINKFQIANEIYRELCERKMISPEALIKIRNKAMDKLGIKISTKKLYNELIEYFYPMNYISRTSYNPKRVEKAGYFYDKTLKAKNDIIALEEIQQEASEFIREIAKEKEKKLEKELEKELEEEKKVIKGEEELGTMFVISIIILFFLILSLTLRILLN